MSVLEHLQPASVLRFFEELCAIPHGSGNTKAISDYCADFARMRGLEYYQDALNNVIMIKPAAAGYEDAPAVILQGHMDMVCEKAEDCTVDMAKDGLRLQTDGAWVWAEGTTLGGDDGIAVAMGLALLDDNSVAHPRLEVVLTVDEEVGMEGAVGLDVSPLQGRLMLNVDSEVEGIMTVSCAGGVRATCCVPVEREAADGVCRRLVIEGLSGGHSGVEIHKGRANANLLMGRLLSALVKKLPVYIAELEGGQADNAIASRCSAVVKVAKDDAAKVEEIVAVCGAVFAREYQTADPNLAVLVEEADDRVLPLSKEATERVISALLLIPNGVQTMSMDIEGLVQTSLNLGVLRLKADELFMTSAVRSSLATEKAMICERLDCLVKLLGGHVDYLGDYPAWEYKKDSGLRDLVCDVYEKQTGKQAVIEAIHAGLECGVFAGKLPGLDCISLGPNLKDIHTPRERMEVASVERTWELVKEILRRTKELKA